MPFTQEWQRYGCTFTSTSPEGSDFRASAHDACISRVVNVLTLMQTDRCAYHSNSYVANVMVQEHCNNKYPLLLR